MKKKKNFFSSTEEDIARRAKLFKYRILVTIGVILLAALWMQIRGKARAKKSKQKSEIRAELHKEALTKFLNHPLLHDTYHFVAKKNGPGISAAISASINSIDSAEVLLSYYDRENYLGSEAITPRQLQAFSDMDTMRISFGESRWLLTGIKSFERKDGPNFKPFSVSKLAVTLRVIGGAAMLLNIENIKGTAILKSGLPHELREGNIKFYITKEGSRAEFRVMGKSEQSEEWSRRIVVHGWKAYVFPE